MHWRHSRHPYTFIPSQSLLWADPGFSHAPQVRLLGAVLEEPGSEKCGVWARELMELLYPLAARSRIVAALLLQVGWIFVRHRHGFSCRILEDTNAGSRR